MNSLFSYTGTIQSRSRLKRLQKKIE